MAGAKLVILDEPTSVLAPQEVDTLFAGLRMLRASGFSVIIITHKLHEARAIADRVTVLRGGKVILGGVDPTTLDDRELIGAMVGRTVPALPASRPAAKIGRHARPRAARRLGQGRPRPPGPPRRRPRRAQRRAGRRGRRVRQRAAGALRGGHGPAPGGHRNGHGGGPPADEGRGAGRPRGGRRRHPRGSRRRRGGPRPVGGRAHGPGRPQAAPQGPGYRLGGRPPPALHPGRGDPAAHGRAEPAGGEPLRRQHPAGHPHPGAGPAVHPGGGRLSQPRPRRGDDPPHPGAPAGAAGRREPACW